MVKRQSSTYSIIQPIFEKAVRCINSSQTLEQLEASQQYACNFLSLIQDQARLGEMPLGHSRFILSTFYGQAIKEALIKHPLFKQLGS